ncbi:protein of unknown function [Acidithiobacillus ferrivorans]|uniref:Uncharacterized protein n=1 Tax=Acidithiobacillus ferrivorans TaxID=160808 RepID=A0ABY1MT81_9PROT|nr:protein of unknown function [Acidithiobacillus ferrivorans]
MIRICYVTQNLQDPVLNNLWCYIEVDLLYHRQIPRVNREEKRRAYHPSCVSCVCFFVCPI